MTKRPDVFDRSTPSSGWAFWRSWRPLFWRDLFIVVETAVDAFQRALTPRLDLILKEIKKMAVSTDELLADIGTLVAGYQAVKDENAALKTENGELRSALESADADKAAAVAATEAADQAQVDAADAVVDAANAPADDVPAEPAPDAPADGS